MKKKDWLALLAFPFVCVGLAVAFIIYFTIITVEELFDLVTGRSYR